MSAPSVTSRMSTTGPMSLICDLGSHEHWPGQEQLNHSPFQMYGTQTPPYQEDPIQFKVPSLQGSEPHGRTETTHSLNLRPVAAHRYVEAQTRASSCKAGLAESHPEHSEQHGVPTGSVHGHGSDAEVAGNAASG